jgi:tetratricopeptide (TPR) repeat protein
MWTAAVYRLPLLSLACALVVARVGLADAGGARESYDAALKARAGGKLTEATRLLEKAVAGAPSNTDYRLALADAYFATGRYETVIEILRPTNGLPIKPPEGQPLPSETADGLRLLARAFTQLDRLPDARQCFTDLTALAESSAADHFELARIQYFEGKCALAVAPLNAAADRGLDDLALHMLGTQIFTCLGTQLGEVQIVNIPDGRVGQLVAEGFLLESAGEGRFRVAPRDSAVYHVQAARLRDPKSLAVQLLAAQVWLAAKRYSAAVEDYKDLETRLANANWAPPAKAAFYAEFADALYGADDVQGYLERLRQAFELDSNRYGDALAAGYRRAAERYNQRGDVGNFVRCLEQALAESPKDADLRYRLGNGYWEAGRLREAAREYQLTLQLVPDHRDRDRMLQAIERASRK